VVGGRLDRAALRVLRFRHPARARHLARPRAGV